MELIIWSNVVILAIISQYYIIEIKGIYPNKLLWFITRIIIALLFMIWYSYLGYIWYWSLIFMAGTFWFPFNEGLNFLREKPFGYLSPKNSFFDRLIIKYLPGGTFVYVVFGIMFFIYSIAQMIIYGKLTWTQINNGW